MKYYITEMGNLPSKFFNINQPIMVEVIPEDFVDYYMNEKDDIDYKENLMENERWLVFKNYPGKVNWLRKKQWDCEEGNYWEIDFEDFIPHMMSINEFATGESFMRAMYEVILVKDNLDIVEAKEKGINCNTKTGSQRLLETLDLNTIGQSGNEYYVVSWDENKNMIYAISSDAPERDEAGNFFVDVLYYLRQSYEKQGVLDVVKIDKKVGIYNYLTRQFFKFAH